MQKINEEFIEKYETIRKQAEDEYPDGKWFIEPLIWDDNTFLITAIHNRTDGRKWQWRCRMSIGSEDSSYPTDIKEEVLWTRNPEEIGYFTRYEYMI